MNGPLSPPFRLAPDALLQRVGDETALIHLQHDCYYTLDDVGTQMLEVLLATQNVGATVAQLAAQYDVDAATLHTDLLRITDELIAAELLVTG